MRDAIAASETRFFLEYGRFTGSHAALMKRAALVLDPNLCYGRITLDNSDQSFSFSIGSIDRDAFPIAYSFIIKKDSAMVVSNISDITCISINGKSSYRRGPSEETLQELDNRNSRFTDAINSLSEAEDEVLHQYKRYTSSYEELVSWGAYLSESICYSEITAGTLTNTSTPGYEFKYRHVDSEKYPYAQLFRSSANNRLYPANGIIFDCVVGSKRAEPVAVPVVPDKPATPVPPDADVKVKAAYDAVAKAETEFFYNNTRYTESYSDLVDAGFLKIDYNICYGALELNYNDQTSTNGFKFKVRYGKGSSPVYTYDSTLKGEKVSVTPGAFTCDMGSYVP